MAEVEQERRRHQRLAKILDGHWRGAGGSSACRIVDISWGGCFIQTLAEPQIGERTVVCLERAAGFSVQFDELSAAQIKGLKPLLGEPPVYS